MAGASMTHEVVSTVNTNYRAVTKEEKTHSLNWLTKAAFWKFKVVLTCTDNIWKCVSLSIFKQTTSLQEGLYLRSDSTSQDKLWEATSCTVVIKTPDAMTSDRYHIQNLTRHHNLTISDTHPYLNLLSHWQEKRQNIKCQTS